MNYPKELIQIAKNIKFDPLKSIITVDNIDNHITKKQSELLYFFISKKKQLISFDEIYANIWRINPPTSDTTLRTYIKNIRKILGKHSISTIYKSGYIYEL